MKTYFVRLYWSIKSLRWILPEKIGQYIGLTLNVHIPTRRPPAPSEFCSVCGKQLVKLIAIDAGDGWDIEWECEDENCWGMGDTIPAVGWWPFWFGAWATSADLERVGIEVA